MVLQKSVKKKWNTKKIPNMPVENPSILEEKTDIPEDK